ncbi:MAG TPA: bifunctional phosphopantothenoylcysteine decarboxylase/phosphopantothenate--cysteine ligase CoaBC [Gammaproteobacteria bacterium]|nr:bifunctional phosphopantothenoylcysteine decarboxylase/phosphopantothenate--cysteine ligase CoaBC [Gammaproteobacteria bacterium]
MQRLNGKHVLLGVTGGIAACKSADLVRRLREAGAEVRVVLTEAGARFVTPLAFEALSGHPVAGRMFDPQGRGAMEHIDLARWADVILVAPATAHTIARLSHGLADDLLTTICLASSAPLALAPAMNRQMWDNPATRANVERLRERGAHLFGPADGELACGESGMGRMLEPTQLAELLAGLFAAPLLAGVRVMVTAGPTLEDIDPVRYIGNRSSGKMGYAVAAAALQAGAEVTLVSGETCLSPPCGVTVVRVRSAAEMYAAVMQRVTHCDIFVGAAAVADYRPVRRAGQKIKRDRVRMELQLERNPDILGEVSALDRRPFCVGFAAETERVTEHARAKMSGRGLDMIAANRVGEPDSGFESDTNSLEVLWNGGGEAIPLATKERVAQRLVELIAQRYGKRPFAGSTG